ncbi:MAG: Crp/Fnr family transcriptional regulator [Alphaproteobacteria bacterium]|nr:MAG: Crp/Fnr family transcriptional regulator [Alphaproteobacteria bacterium]
MIHSHLVFGASMPIELNRRFIHEHVREYEDGELIFKEGDEGRDLYIIQDGGAVIKKKTAVGEVTLAEFSRGDFFGDMALLQDIPRFASSYSKGKSKILILQPGGFLLKIRRDPTFAFEMIQQLSSRLKLTSERFLEAVTSGEVSKETAHDILVSAETVHLRKT